MESIRAIASLIDHAAKWTHRIQEAKLSPEEVRFLYQTVDQKRKGFLDLADIY